MKITIDTTETLSQKDREILNLLLNETPKVEKKAAEIKAKAPARPKTEKKVETPTPAPEKASAVTIDDLKNEAKEATKRTDRLTVKKAIGKYADKLVDVKVDDYEALLADLKGL